MSGRASGLDKNWTEIRKARSSEPGLEVQDPAYGCVGRVLLRRAGPAAWGGSCPLDPPWSDQKSNCPPILKNRACRIWVGCCQTVPAAVIAYALL